MKIFLVTVLSGFFLSSEADASFKCSKNAEAAALKKSNNDGEVSLVNEISSSVDSETFRVAVTDNFSKKTFYEVTLKRSTCEVKSVGVHL